MKKQKILSIFMAVCLLVTTVFGNLSYGESVSYLGELTTNEVLLSELIYDDYILKAPLGKGIDITKYDEFYDKCTTYVERKDIMYDNVDVLAKELSKYKLVKVKIDKKTGFKGAIFKRTYNGKSHYTVVFCGTENLKDWQNNAIEVVLNAFDNQRTHAISLAKEAIKDNPGYLVITGHSLGGFLTQSVATEIYENNIKVPSTTSWRASTFNAPGLLLPKNAMSKVRNKSYTDYYNSVDDKLRSYSKITNYSIDGDFVANFGKHVGKDVVYEKHITNISKYHSLYNFHKYGYWYKKSFSNLIVRNVYHGDNYVTGRAPANKKVSAVVNGKTIGSSTSSSTGYYKVKIPQQSDGTSIKIISTDKNGKVWYKTTKVIKELKLNQIYADDTYIKGKTFPKSTVRAHKGKLQIGSNVKADKNGNFQIKVDKNNVRFNEIIEITTTKTSYPQQYTAMRVFNKINTLTLNKVYTSNKSISGKTISKAKVTAYAGGKKVGSTTADKSGNYKIEIGTQKKGTVIKVVASKTAYKSKEISTTVVASKKTSLKVNKIYYGYTTISGTATAGSKVRAYYGSKQIGKTATADKNGNYKITDVPIKSSGSTIKVKASKTNYLTSEVSNKVYQRSISKLTTSTFYTSSTSISGTTTAGATVKAYVGSKQIGKTVTAGKDGKYKISSIPKQSKGKTITIKATKKYYTSKTVKIQVKVKTASSVRLPFISNGKLGYMDEKGNVLIKPKFNYFYSEMDEMVYAGEFENNRAQIQTSSGKTRYINTSGNYINSYSYDFGTDFSEGLAVAYRSGKYRFINTDGKEIYSTSRNVLTSLNDGLMIFEQNGKYGYMDKTGNVIIKPQFQLARSFYKGYAIVELTNGNLAIIDKKGNNKTKGFRLGQYMNYHSYDQPVVSEGMFALLGDGGYVFADINNPTNIKIYKKKVGQDIHGFDDVGIFMEGLAPVKVDGKWGYINKSGKMVIQPTYNFAGYFDNGYAVVGKGSQCIIINKQGSVVSKNLWNFNEGSISIEGKLVQYNNSKGFKYYDFNGKVIKPKL